MTAADFYPEATVGHGVRQQVGASAPTCTTLTLPMPPSVNEMWANKSARAGRPGGRFKTLKYKNWILEAAVELRQQNPDRVEGRVLVNISVERDSDAADIDNRIKAMLDLMVQPGLKRTDRIFGVIDDDRFVTGITVSWAPRGSSRHGKARIAIMPVTSVTATFHPSPDGATGGWFYEAPDNDTEV